MIRSGIARRSVRIAVAQISVTVDVRVSGRVRTVRQGRAAGEGTLRLALVVVATHGVAHGDQLVHDVVGRSRVGSRVAVAALRLAGLARHLAGGALRCRDAGLALGVVLGDGVRLAQEAPGVGALTHGRDAQAGHREVKRVRVKAAVVTLSLLVVQLKRRREREMFCLTTHSTHFIYGYMASDIW